MIMHDDLSPYSNVAFITKIDLYRCAICFLLASTSPKGALEHAIRYESVLIANALKKALHKPYLLF